VQAPGLAHFQDPFNDLRVLVAHLAQVADLKAWTGGRDGQGDRVLVNIKTNVLRYLLHLDRLPCGSAPRLGYSAA